MSTHPWIISEGTSPRWPLKDEENIQMVDCRPCFEFIRCSSVSHNDHGFPPRVVRESNIGSEALSCSCHPQQLPSSLRSASITLDEEWQGHPNDCHCHWAPLETFIWHPLATQVLNKVRRFSSRKQLPTHSIVYTHQYITSTTYKWTAQICVIVADCSSQRRIYKYLKNMRDFERIDWIPSICDRSEGFRPVWMNTKRLWGHSRKVGKMNSGWRGLPALWAGRRGEDAAVALMKQPAD